MLLCYSLQLFGVPREYTWMIHSARWASDNFDNAKRRRVSVRAACYAPLADYMGYPALLLTLCSVSRIPA